MAERGQLPDAPEDSLQAHEPRLSPPVHGLRRAMAVTDLERMVPYQGPVTCEECGNLIHPLGWDAHTRSCPAVIDRIVATETADLDKRLMIWLQSGRPRPSSSKPGTS